MTVFQATILGIVQGITEFLPISSSAHLVLTPYFLGWEIPKEQVFVFDVLIQVGTLVAVIVYFWKDLWAVAKALMKGLAQKKLFVEPEARLGWYIIVATIPAITFGLFFKDYVESALNSVFATAIFLLFTGGLLLSGEYFGKQTSSIENLNWRDALLVGFFQLFALFPGVSRSGSTISGGMFRNLNRESAARFSFLMAVPVMIGAGLVSIVDLLNVPNLGGFMGPLIVGFITSAIVGYLSIRWLLAYLARKPLYIFAIYVVLVAAGTLLKIV